MAEYRPIPDRRATFHEYRQYSFGAERGLPPYEPDEHDAPRALLGDRRGLFADGAADDADPRCVCRHYWLRSSVRGERHPVAGLASVATPPEYRRQGYVRQLLARSLEEYRERGDRFALLWPFKYRFYRKYGWETANRIALHEFEPDVLAPVSTRGENDRSGAIRRLEADEYRTLEPAYERHAERYSLALERDESWWRHRVLGGDDVDPFVAAYERDDRTAGYLVYTIDDERGERILNASELLADDHDALLALLSFCYAHDSQVDRIRLRLPTDAPLRETVRDPDEVETTVETGPMVRIVDVERTLSALSYPEREAALVLAVDDPLADWNAGTFELEVAGGDGDCKRVDERRETAPADADVHLDIAALSRLVVGSRSARDLDRTNRFETRRRTAVSTLTALFPETSVFLGEYF